MAYVTKVQGNDFFRMKLGSMPDFSGSKIVDQEVPTGAYTGLNAEFNLAFAPIRYSEKIHKDGMLMKRASDKTFADGDYYVDYSNGRLVFSATQIPQLDSVVLAEYKHY